MQNFGKLCATFLIEIILYDSVELKIKDIKMLLMKKHYTFIQGSKRQKVFKKEINDGITA